MEEKEKTPAQLRREALLDDRKNGYDRLTPEDEAAMQSYCEDYKKFLDAAKTEREAVDEVVRLAQAKGFVPFTRGMSANPGDKFYRVNRGKAIMLAVIGDKPLADGVSIGAAHIDSPRLDLKPEPLYEDSEMAFLKTHYYGGIRKYQWVTIPLELHGVIVKKDGSTVKVAIGTCPGDPLFTVDDLLPHLGAEQSKKPLGEAIPGESLNILVGSRPFKDDDGSDRVKLAILDILNQKYGLVEADFISAELEAVPAFRASDIGFDRSLIGAYGQDDRVCAYASLAALLETERPAHTAVCMLADKEEIGSEGVSGMKSAAFDTFMSDLCDAQRVALKVCYEHSFSSLFRRDGSLRSQLRFGLRQVQRRPGELRHGLLQIHRCAGQVGRVRRFRRGGWLRPPHPGRRRSDLADVRAGRGGRRRRRYRGGLYGRAGHRHTGRGRACAEHALSL